MNEVQPIPRYKRVTDTISNFKKKGPFKNLDEVVNHFIATFDEVELQAAQHNKKVRNGSMETIYMSVPTPTKHLLYEGIYYSVATKHIILFSTWGAFALYRKLPGVYDEIINYRANELCPALAEKKGACGRGIWDF